MQTLFNELQATFEGKGYLTEAGKIEFRRRLDILATEMLKMPQAELPLKHYFSKGVYTREMHAKAGTLILGRIHKYETVNILAKGKILILSEEGVKELEAPATFVSGPGVQKLGYVIEDVIFMNSFATDKTDPEEALNEVTIDPKTHISFYLEKDRESFRETIKELGFTEAEVRSMSEITSDLVTSDIYKSYWPVDVRDSKIEGKGLFATWDLKEGESIMPARIGTKRTIAGRYVNHSASPNCKMIYDEGEDVIYLTAIKPINNGDELTVDYKQSFLTARLADRKEAV